jgi:DNA anti-recombination protein RmuC
MKSLVHLIEVDGVKGVYFAVWPLLVPYLSWVTLIWTEENINLKYAGIPQVFGKVYSKY